MANQNRAPLALGFTPNSASTAMTTLALSAANTWLAYGIAPDSGKTLDSVRAYISATAGTLIAGDVTCSICSDNAGSPGTVLETKNCTTAPSGAGWYDWTGFTTALTAGNQYWLVFKNLNATPASNTPTFRYGSTAFWPLLAGSAGTGYGWVKKHTTDGGSSYVTTIASTAGWRVGYSDGSYAGAPAQANATPTDLVYGTREYGAKLTLPGPSTLTWKVRGLLFWCNSSWSGALGDLAFRLYTGTNTPASGGAAATSNGGMTRNNVAASGYYRSMFASPVSVAGGSVVRATMCVPAGTGSSINYYFAQGAEYTFDSDSNSLPLMPVDGTAQKTYWDGTGPNWADTANVLAPFALLLDSDGEFTTTGGGGGTTVVFNIEG
jgi:hypothetical protein